MRAYYDWQAQLMKKVANLERLLAEERQKVTAVEKRLQLREESQAQQDEHSKMHTKEMSVIQQEVRSVTAHARLSRALFLVASERSQRFAGRRL